MSTVRPDALGSPNLESSPEEVKQGSGRPVVLVGNPNVGKSVLFGLLTGRYVTVSNYPGTTVTLTRGRGRVGGETVEILDTPGVNSLLPMSEDEKVTRDILLGQAGQRVIQVADARNLRRALLLTFPLAEMGVPLVLDLNMTDEAKSAGIRVDEAALGQALGIPVVKTVAVRRRGFDRLREAIQEARPSTYTVTYPEEIERAVGALFPHLPESPLSRRSLALLFLAGDETLRPWLAARVGDQALLAMETIRRQAEAAMHQPLGAVMTRVRLRETDRLLARVERRPGTRGASWLDTAGSLAMHPLWGVPVLLAVLYAMYQFVGVFGAGMAVNFLEGTVFGHVISPAAIRLVDAVLRYPHAHQLANGILLPASAPLGALTGAQEVARFLHDLLVGPYGQITMALSYAIALILPIVATFFLAFGVLEDSGYLPRLAVMVNRMFRVIGLNGKAVLPMVLGLGCDTMATLTTRILETKKERVLVTLLLALGVPCSAQLGVILGMMRSLSLGATLVWAGTVAVTLLVVGWLAARVVPGTTSDFILELPPIRMPQAGNLVVKTMARIEWYLREAVPLFLVGTLLLFLLNAFRLLGVVERLSAPVVVHVLGLPARAAEAFLIGFLRRDYGAAGLYDMARQGLMDPAQLVVSMVTITLFVPCMANFLIMIKERGVRTALAMTAFIVPLAFAVGGALRWGLHALEVHF